MRKIAIHLALCAMLLAHCAAASAPQPTKIPQIGFLSGSPPSTAPGRREAFRQGLRELGHVEGKNIVIEWRYAEGKFDRLPAFAAELVRLKVDIIVTAGPQTTRPAKQATSTIPIVMAQDPDPVGNGFVVSLARPGRNITGLATFAPEISGKQLELMKEIIPKLSRVAVFGTSTNSGNAQMLREVELTAKAFGVKLQYLDVLSPKDIETAFRAASKARADAVLMLPGPVLVLQRAQLTVVTHFELPDFCFSAQRWADERWYGIGAHERFFKLEGLGFNGDYSRRIRNYCRAAWLGDTSNANG